MAKYHRKALTNADIDAIVLNDSYGMSQTENAAKTGFSLRTVWVVINANKAVKDKDWQRCIDMIWKNRAALNTFSWLAVRNGVSLPTEVADAYRKMCDSVTQPKTKPAPDPEANPATEPKPALSNPVLSNEDKFFLAVLRYLETQNKLIREQNERLEKVLAILS